MYVRISDFTNFFAELLSHLLGKECWHNYSKNTTTIFICFLHRHYNIYIRIYRMWDESEINRIKGLYSSRQQNDNKGMLGIPVTDKSCCKVCSVWTADTAIHSFSVSHLLWKGTWHCIVSSFTDVLSTCMNSGFFSVHSQLNSIWQQGSETNQPYHCYMFFLANRKLVQQTNLVPNANR